MVSGFGSDKQRLGYLRKVLVYIRQKAITRNVLGLQQTRDKTAFIPKVSLAP